MYGANSNVSRERKNFLSFPFILIILTSETRKIQENKNKLVNHRYQAKPLQMNNGSKK